jgi:hypothetical protein
VGLAQVGEKKKKKPKSKKDWGCGLSGRVLKYQTLSSILSTKKKKKKKKGRKKNKNSQASSPCL